MQNNYNPHRFAVFYNLNAQLFFIFIFAIAPIFVTLLHGRFKIYARRKNFCS